MSLTRENELKNTIKFDMAYVFLSKLLSTKLITHYVNIFIVISC